MKKLVPFIFIILILLAILFGNKKINENNVFDIYEKSKIKILNATTIEATTVNTFINKSPSQTKKNSYTSIYSEIKNKDDSYTSHVNIFNDSLESPFSMELFYIDNTIYTNINNTIEETKFEDENTDFSEAYNNINLLDLHKDAILSYSLTKTYNDEYILSLTLDEKYYENIFDIELTMIESILEIPVINLSPTFSNIDYIITFDPKGNIKTIDTTYSIDVTIPLSKILDKTSSTTLNKSFTRTINTVTNINKLNSKLTIEMETF